MIIKSIDYSVTFRLWFSQRIFSI